MTNGGDQMWKPKRHLKIAALKWRYRRSPDVRVLFGLWLMSSECQDSPSEPGHTANCICINSHQKFFDGRCIYRPPISLED